MGLTPLLTLSILIVFSFQAVNPLRCYVCSDPPECTRTDIRTCRQGYSCFLAVAQFGYFDKAYQKCTSNCRGGQLPTGAHSATSSCCDTDLCNYDPNSAVTNKMSLVTAGFVVLVSLYVSRY